MDEGIVLVGHVSKPFGIQGWVHVVSYTVPADNIFKYRPWFLGERVGSSTRWAALDSIETQSQASGLVARIDCSETRTDAEQFARRTIGVPRDKLPKLSNDEFYWIDLEDTVVENEKHETLGKVSEVIPNGAHEILRVNGENGEYLIPFVNDIVSSVQPGEKIIVEWNADWQ